MPRSLMYALIWSEEKESYRLHIYGQPERWFRPGDEAAFSSWLEERTAFAFVGQAGHLSVLKEARPRGASY